MPNPAKLELATIVLSTAVTVGGAVWHLRKIVLDWVAGSRIHQRRLDCIAGQFGVDLHLLRRGIVSWWLGSSTSRPEASGPTSIYSCRRAWGSPSTGDWEAGTTGPAVTIQLGIFDQVRFGPRGLPARNCSGEGAWPCSSTSLCWPVFMSSAMPYDQ